MSAATTALVGAVAGNAVAYWSVTGSGAASGRALSPGEISVSAAGVDGLAPGGDPLAVHVTVHNGGTTTYEPDTVIPVVSGGATGCPTTVVSANPPPYLPAIPSGGTVVVDVQVTLSTQAPAQCQGATFGLTLTVTGHWL